VLCAWRHTGTAGVGRAGGGARARAVKMTRTVALATRNPHVKMHFGFLFVDDACGGEKWAGKLSQWTYCPETTCGIWNNQGGNEWGAKFPGCRITGGGAENSQQCHKCFLQCTTLAPERPCFLPRAPSNLVTPLGRTFTFCEVKRKNEVKSFR